MKNKILIFIIMITLALSLCACNLTCNHDLIEIAQIDATCTSDGNIAHWKCLKCKQIFQDKSATKKLEKVIIPAGHKFSEYQYDYENKKYVRNCNNCNETENIIAGTIDFPLLARDENELTMVVANANENSYIMLANDITITASNYGMILKIPNNGTLDLGGYTITVKNNTGLVIEGTDVTLKNGKFDTDFKNPKEGYAVFIGDESENNRITIKDIDTKGGFNVYNCIATFHNCNVDASGRDYYALWADSHSTIIIESGEYHGGDIACVHSTASYDEEGNGQVILNGGIFYGKINATYGTYINGGVFDSNIVLTPYTKSNTTYDAKLIVNKNYMLELNICVENTKYEMVKSLDDKQNSVYETKVKEQN